MQNIDGIKKIAKTKTVSGPIIKTNRSLLVDGVVSKQSKKHLQKEIFYTGFFVPPKNYKKLFPSKVLKKLFFQYLDFVENVFIKFQRFFTFLLKRFNLSGKVVPVYALTAVLAAGFGVGVWATLSTQKSEAQNVVQTQAGSIAIEAGANLGPINSISNDVLFNMTIGQLENYLNSLAEQNRALKLAEIIAIRKEKLYAYLKSKNTPFAEVSGTIAEQKHWKLILAISFAESTFGRNCVDNNCSNIGVKPGHAYWRKYKSLDDWVKDFDKLLERKYKDWTLEEMNGVYVQPKNPNWLAATRQILEELQEQGIE